MSINFQRTSLDGHTPEIWRGECKVLPGSFKLQGYEQDGKNGEVLLRGTLLSVDTKAHTAYTCKWAKLFKATTANSNTIEVASLAGCKWCKGDPIKVAGDTATAPNCVVAVEEVAAVAGVEEDTSHGIAAVEAVAAHTKLTLKNSIAPELAKDSAVNNGGHLANAVLAADFVNDGKQYGYVAAAYEAVVLASDKQLDEMPTDEIAGGANGCGFIALKANPSIKLIKQ